MKKTTLGVFACTLALPSLVFALTPSVGDITDNRSTGSFFNRLEMELKLIGDEINDVDAVRITLDKAVDDTGRDIINPEKRDNSFQSLTQFGSKNNVLKVEFKNPSRKAGNIQELSGKLELFVPKNDPAASISIANIMSQTGKPIDHSALKSAKVELSVYTPQQQQEQQKKEREAEMAKAAAQGVNNALAGAMDSFFGGGGAGEENNLIFRISDPELKIVSYELRTASGEEIRNNGSMTSGDMKTLFFSEKVPADASLVVKIATAKATTAMPLKLANIALP